MRTRFWVIAFVGGAALLASACRSLPLYPDVLPAYEETFRAPYEMVWDATLRSLGIVPIRVADKSAGRIETDVYVFVFSVQNGGARPTQAIWADLTIQVRPIAPEATHVAVQARVHNALLRGFFPGGSINTPWADMFAKIHAYLRPPA